MKMTKIRYIVRNANDGSKIGYGNAYIHEDNGSLYIMHDGKKTSLFFDGYEWYVMI